MDLVRTEKAGSATSVPPESKLAAEFVLAETAEMDPQVQDAASGDVATQSMNAVPDLGPLKARQASQWHG